ncbi:MAG: glycosyltransferase family 39 protein, partial [Desulfoferrobacter sp.]
MSKSNILKRDYLIVIVLLATFAAMAVTSMLRKSATFDEPLHLAAGYAYWTQNEYRFSTENGNLAQRWAALPLLFGDYHFPAGTRGNFRIGFDFLFNSGNDAKNILMQGRAMMVLLGLALGILVYLWSRQLFGRSGGLLSLTLYCFSPTILAHTRLATSDLTVALFFTLSVWCIWKMLHRVSIATVIYCGLAIGALFVSKMSAVLIVPMALILIAVRLFSREPLLFAIGKAKTIVSKPKKAQIFVALFLIQILLVAGVVRAFYGFRFSAKESAPVQRLQPVKKEVTTAEAKKPVDETAERSAAAKERPRDLHREPPFIRSLIQFAGKYRLMPEAYLQGLQVVARYSLVRPAFFNGRYGAGGWHWFFPYCFMVKTPLPLFLLLFLGLIATALGWHLSRKEKNVSWLKTVSQSLYRTSPLWVLLGVYWATAINTNLNIGQRHILPVYPATFILAGAAAFWLRRQYLIPATCVIATACLFMSESIRIWPDYLAYFNQIIGGPRNGYKHLVDSSLDWGQDLPALKQWLDREVMNKDKNTPVYLSYFGNGNPTYYGISAQRLPGCLDLDVGRPEIFSLHGGIYCISAT